MSRAWSRECNACLKSLQGLHLLYDPRELRIEGLVDSGDVGQVIISVSDGAFGETLDLRVEASD